MTFWEGFFSTDKIIYPITGCVGFTLLMMLLSAAINLNISEYIIYTFMIIGFLIGNAIKTQKLIE